MPRSRSSGAELRVVMVCAPPVVRRGAASGEGLGNAFLSHIQAVDGILHVCRGFEVRLPKYRTSYPAQVI